MHEINVIYLPTNCNNSSPLWIISLRAVRFFFFFVFSRWPWSDLTKLRKQRMQKQYLSDRHNARSKEAHLSCGFWHWCTRQHTQRSALFSFTCPCHSSCQLVPETKTAWTLRKICALSPLFTAYAHARFHLFGGDLWDTFLIAACSIALLFMEHISNSPCRVALLFTGHIYNSPCRVALISWDTFIIVHAVLHSSSWNTFITVYVVWLCTSVCLFNGIHGLRDACSQFLDECPGHTPWFGSSRSCLSVCPTFQDNDPFQA